MPHRSKRPTRGRAAFATAAFVLCHGAQALPVTVDNVFMNLEHRGVNSLGFSAGELMRVGAATVRPNGDAGTVGFGSTVNTVTGEVVNRTVFFTPSPAIPNFFSRVMPYDPQLTGPWTLSFLNGSDFTQRVVSLPAGTRQLPFVNGITLSGSSDHPTFTWSPPPGVHIDGYRVNIIDRSLIRPGNGGQVTSRDLGPGTTSYTVDGSDFTVPGYGFSLNTAYAIEISALQTRDGSSRTRNDNLQAVSRVYADFTARASGGPLVNLPVLRPDGVYQYNLSVKAGQTYHIDPLIAVGYDFAIGQGDPSFASVTLPTGIGDGLYDLYGWQGGQPVLLKKDLAGGTTYGFAPAGVTAFRVAGIETSAGLDPASTTAFVTAVSFTADGVFTGTQTPITTAVPEPGTWALFASGLAALAGLTGVQRSGRRG